MCQNIEALYSNLPESHENQGHFNKAEQVLGYYNKAGPNFSQMEDDIKKALDCKKNGK